MTSPPPRRRSVWTRLRARVFHGYFLLARPMTLGVRALVYNAREETVFLVRHTYVPGWHLPGGGVEAGETMLDALARELAEEGNIGWRSPPRLVSVHFNRRMSRRDHVAFYHVGDFEQSAPFVPNREIAEAGFFALDALPDGTDQATRQRIAEVVRGAAVSPEW